MGLRRSSDTFRMTFLAALVLLCLGILVARLWWVQIARGAEYTAKIRGRSQVTVRLPAVRGEILDRNGVKLAENRGSFEIDLYLPDIVRAYRNEHGGKVPEISYIRYARHGAEKRKEADISSIINQTIIPELRRLDLEEDYNGERMQVHYRNDTLIPFTYRQDLDFQTMARYLENSVSLPGVKAELKPVRYYPYGAFAAHILGYVGAAVDLQKEREKEAEAGREYSFYQPDVEGKAQIEFYLDEYLRGTPGVKKMQRDARGRILEDDIELEAPKQGANVYLTLDARIQYITEQALRVVGRGAAVVIDPNNGDILAMASVPSFDPNQFIPSIAGKDWAQLTKDETNPLLNRAISAYAPGSTYKIPIALAGLRAGIGNRRFTCTGGVMYGDKYMRCWIADKGGTHGSLSLADAIKVSCNAFFYQYGNAAGIDQIVATGNLLGLGQKSGIPLSGEAPGVLPGPQWLAEVEPTTRWTSGLTANTAIGQGYVLASPLQMAMVVAAVANGGVSYYPRLIDKVVAQDGAVLLQEPAKVRGDLTKEGGFTQEQIDLVRRGMWKVVNEPGGTAGRARIKGVEVAGKTGTAQFWRKGVKDNHTWFIAFAPFDQPKYAIVVLVQGAKSGGGVSAPIAAKILEDIFAMDDGTKPVSLAALQPAVGNFRFTEAIDFNREIPAASTIGADEETTTVSSSAPQDNGPPSGETVPTIRDEPDRRGKVRSSEPKKERKGLLNFFNFLGGKKKQESAPPSGRNRSRSP